MSNEPITVVADGNTYIAHFEEGRGADQSGYVVRNVNNNTYVGKVVSAGPNFGYGMLLSTGTNFTFRDRTVETPQDLIEAAIAQYVRLKP